MQNRYPESSNGIRFISGSFKLATADAEQGNTFTFRERNECLRYSFRAVVTPGEYDKSYPLMFI